ncbi:(2Fe-2S)-binding protein [Streptomyces sp.]|uniref:(2Fe-2S)-binding protein n=1 Tax=Streptomyces sp. TaxID=1931 RepID=UPI002F3E94C5
MTAKKKARPRTVTVVVDGTPRRAWEGQSVAAALVAGGTWALRRNPVTGDTRGPFCGMGVCLECEVVIDGRPGSRSCTEHVADGMEIRTLAYGGVVRQGEGAGECGAVRQGPGTGEGAAV